MYMFDRDGTVDSSGHNPGPIPLEWLMYLNEETPYPVWAVGNQRLRGEAGIPGLRTAINKSQFKSRKTTGHERTTRVKIVASLYPDIGHFVVVDDMIREYDELRGLPEWDIYLPEEFVEQHGPPWDGQQRLEDFMDR